jgi:hypothetical protein
MILSIGGTFDDFVSKQRLNNEILREYLSRWIKEKELSKCQKTLRSIYIKLCTL